MSAIHSTGKENSNADLIAMLSELDCLDEPSTGEADVVEVKKTSAITTDDLFSELLPLVAAPKSEVKKSEKEVIATLLGDIEDEIEVVTPPPAEEKPVIEAEAESVIETTPVIEPEPEKESELASAPEPAPVKREPAARRKRFSMDQLSDEAMESLGFDRKAFMDGYNACPVKAMDKVQNVMAWSQGLSDLSVYTIISVTHLIKSGSADTAGFRLAMMSNPEKPYPSSTASAQAGQMMSILPVLGMATKDGKMLKLNEESPLVKKFKSEAM